MTTRACFILLFFLFTLPLQTQAGDDTWGDSRQSGFGELQFGDPPSADMICFRGPCPSDREGAINRNPGSIVAKYKKTTDITQYNLIEVSPPTYEFFNKRLVRVQLELLCEGEAGRQCIDTVVRKLDEEYGLELIEENLMVLSPQIEYLNLAYLSDGGGVVEVGWQKTSGRWQAPHINIYDWALMEDLRLACNPDYVPRSLPDTP